MILTIFTSNISAFYRIQLEITRFYKSLWKFMKATIFHNIFSVKSLAFVPFHSLAMYFLHFVISYRDEQNFPVCYCTVSPLDISANILPSSNDWWYFQYSRYLLLNTYKWDKSFQTEREETNRHRQWYPYSRWRLGPIGLVEIACTIRKKNGNMVILVLKATDLN